MRRSFEAYLWDIQDRGTNILKFIGPSSEEHDIQKEFPDQISQITEYDEVISFRNELAHGYSWLNHHQVWAVVKNDLPKLLGQVSALLQQSPPRA